ncbi:MAG: bifunctional adenosylcobinamide kinase/adenosylcobinamide-phosphate guanylyltransferase [Clostridiales bacterium]|nr:bifunctional adenosylcobinamide kinase/adenosylcobinamide-phosphate guanylyltransferase [Clostridiales bacterium]
MWLVVIIAIVLGYILFRKFFKVPAFSAVTMITGGVKSGKSALTVRFALKAYKRARVHWYISRVFAKLFRREKPEEPLLYSNIPLRKIKYSPLLLDHLLRKSRLNYKSVVILDEASLVADSMLGVSKSKGSSDISTQLLLFFKLFGHETKGGKIFCNSHCLSDLHFALKRTTSTYFYVHSLRRFPFISSFNLREERYSDDGGVVNAYSEDAQKSMMHILMFNGMFKRYDAFCYSALTDDLPLNNKVRSLSDWADLKTKQIISFRKEFQDLGALKPAPAPKLRSAPKPIPAPSPGVSSDDDEASFVDIFPEVEHEETQSTDT